MLSLTSPGCKRNKKAIVGFISTLVNYNGAMITNSIQWRSIKSRKATSTINNTMNNIKTRKACHKMLSIYKTIRKISKRKISKFNSFIRYR